MSIILVLALIICTILFQWHFCSKMLHIAVKMIPTMTAAVGIVVCWIVFLFSADPAGTGLEAMIWSGMFIVLLLVDILTWVVYGIVCFFRRGKE